MKFFVLTALLLSSMSAFAHTPELQCDDPDLDISISVNKKEAQGNFSEIKFHAFYNKDKNVYEDAQEGVSFIVLNEGSSYKLDITLPDLKWLMSCKEK